MIVNNELLHQNENKIDEKNMVGVIIFGAHDKHGYVIDYIAIDNSYCNNSFGPVLINMSQIFSSMIIKNMSFGKRFKKVCTVFLACIKKEVGSFYDSIGFRQQLNTDIFKSGNDLSKIGDRLKYETWNSPDDESCHLSCYSIDKLCYRWVNRLTPGSFQLEDEDSCITQILLKLVIMGLFRNY